MKALHEDKGDPNFVLPEVSFVTLVESFRLSTSKVFNIPFEISRRLLHSSASGYIGCI